jgi:C1A family cysteine protease
MERKCFPDPYKRREATMAEIETVKEKKAVPAKKVNRILNCLESPQREKDWSIDCAQQAGLIAAPAKLPEKVDLRDDTWWTIGNQGATGSCVGWATADSVLRWYFVQAGRLEKSEKLSTRYIWMAAKETDEFRQRPTSFIETDGTSVKAALDIARKYGVVTESVLPFTGGKLYPGDCDPFYMLASTRRIASYVSLRALFDLNPWDVTIYSFRLWIAHRGPILTRLEVDETFNGLVSDHSGNLDAYRRYPPGQRGGHAVALVGYTPTSFIVRNSWGTGWGDKGYAYASLEYTNNAFKEVYGVIV